MRDGTHRLRATLAIAATVVAALIGCVGALAWFHQDRDVSVGTVRLSVHPGRDGALALYVPLVDWGVRFDAVRFPAQLSVDVRSLDRTAIERVASRRTVDIAALKHSARDAIASYLRMLVVVVALGGLAIGVLAAFALRSRDGPRVRWLVAAAAVTAFACAGSVALLLPPRGQLDRPVYFAHGGDIPRALEAVEAVNRSGRTLTEELDAQLVGLARLVLAPGERTPIPGGTPRLALASDVHNNFLVLPTLRHAADSGPLFMPGDLTDSGSPLEARLVQAVVHSGHPLVFVSGNHDSDTLERDLARGGATVLSQWGQLLPNGHRGPVVVNVAGMRVAGYSDPYMRRRATHYNGANPVPTPAQQGAFDDWVAGVQNGVDVIMVHEPALAQQALTRLKANPPDHPILFLVGHTHVQQLQVTRNVVVLNAGTAGGGGAGNLVEHQPIGIATLTFDVRSGFRPLATDLVTINPGNGAATARHEPLDLSGRTAKPVG